MNQKTSALNIMGSNSKVVAKEVYNSLFELTKNAPTNAKIGHVTDADKERYFKMLPTDITRTFLADTFADMVDSSTTNVNGKRHSHYNTWDTISIPSNHFYQGQPSIDTTIGRYIANKYMFAAPSIIQHTKFINKVMNASCVKDIDEMVGHLYLEDKIDRKQFNSYIDHRDTLGYWLNGMLAHTISEKFLKPLPEIEKRKAELCKKYEKEIAAGNIDVMTNITNELIAYAKELLKDDPGMDLYLSGDLSFDNNYKNNSIIKGAVKNEITGEFDFIDTAFMDGLNVKDIPAYANSILASQYPASIATQDAGYMGKKLLALMQMMQVDEPGSDCGTKNLIPITITKTNKTEMLYTYIDDGSGQLTLLDTENIDSYVGKHVKMRSPMSCKNEKICSKCAGKLFEMLGITNAGLYSVSISHARLNMGLKQKHSSNVSLTTFNVDDVIKEI